MRVEVNLHPFLILSKKQILSSQYQKKITMKRKENLFSFVNKMFFLEDEGLRTGLSFDEVNELLVDNNMGNQKFESKEDMKEEWRKYDELKNYFQNI
jgi:hypothetical protein